MPHAMNQCVPGLFIIAYGAIRIIENLLTLAQGDRDHALIPKLKDLRKIDIVHLLRKLTLIPLEGHHGLAKYFVFQRAPESNDLADEKAFSLGKLHAMHIFHLSLA